MSRKSRQQQTVRAEHQARAAKKKTRTTFILVIVLAVVMLGAGAALLNGWSRPDNTQSAVPVATHLAEIEVEGYGLITAELYGNVAPITVENFAQLAEEGFYDGLTFHRIISGFMIQGGCPLGNGTGGSGRNIKGEFSGNGVNNPITHERGVLSMARSSSPNSASSQFFIMHENAPHLDGAYAAFGRVLTGMEIVDSICARTPVIDNNGTVPAASQPIITRIRVTAIPTAQE